MNERFLQIDRERDARAGILRTWVDGGLTLGNHLYRHLSLSRTPLARYQDDVLRGEVLTRQVLAEKNLPLVYFRHPFLHTGPTREIKQGFEKFLADHGYKVAPATFDHSDWVFTRVYEQAKATHDRKLEKRTRETFLQYFEATCAHYEQVSDELFGRQVPQILVTHANRINADLMPDWLKLLKARGYSFISLDEALADPAYASPDGYVGPDGVSWMDRWSLGLKKPLKKRACPGGPGRHPGPLRRDRGEGAGDQRMRRARRSRATFTLSPARGRGLGEGEWWTHRDSRPSPLTLSR